MLNALVRIANAGPIPVNPQEDAQAASELDFFSAAALARQAAVDQDQGPSAPSLPGGGGGAYRGLGDGPSPPARVALQALAHLIFRVCPAQRTGKGCSRRDLPQGLRTVS